MSTEQFFFNGVNGATGGYLMPSLTPEQVAKIAQGEEFDPDHLLELQKKNRQVKGIDEEFAPIEGVDPKDLAQTGWGVIFAHNADPGIKEALRPLLNLRREQATKKKEHYYQEYTDHKAYRPGESKNSFLARHKVGPGPADPDKMPYYLLIVGDPETIPYRFQYQLDVQYAVGRIHFDTLEEYAQYAQSVVAAETGKVSLSRHATFFGVKNNNDKATQLSADDLIKPLAELMQKDQPNWSVETLVKDDTTKARLGQLLGGSETPSLLFTASHGMGFPSGHERQLRHQGALLCQDWPGTFQGEEPISEDFYFSADDITDDARLLGLIAFNFACYGAGTPQLDDFAHKKDAFSTERLTIAPHAFVARLPQRLLGHHKGGALAVVGHVERAWGCSFVWPDDKHEKTRQLGVFQSALKRMMEGHPVGSAIEYFNERYAELSSDLSSVLEDIKYGAGIESESLARMWTANNDARSYCIIGDPAVKLAIGDVASERPVIEAVTLSTTSAPKEKLFDESLWKEAEMDLIQSLEQFLEKAQQAQVDESEQAQATVLEIKILLDKLSKPSK
ncbi:hypothetical protein [Planktothrix agardhii]|uniref:hypothetical protein n=1 Tax=Planktothrix agardhii TaxID=1160 RepID=UPI0020A7EF19|nr:hypothetical protein [Planktothrix agardhii]CAD5911933.1 hypothetical protein NO758_00096 [Planktothrix agardhii]